MTDTNSRFALLSFNILFLDIARIEPKQGSIAGGSEITIHGDYFGMKKEVIRVKVAGVECTVLSVNNTHIVCLTGQFDASKITGDVQPGMSGSRIDYFVHKKW